MELTIIYGGNLVAQQKSLPAYPEVTIIYDSELINHLKIITITNKTNCSLISSIKSFHALVKQ